MRTKLHGNVVRNIGTAGSNMRTIISPKAALFGAIFYLIGIKLDDSDKTCTESAKGKTSNMPASGDPVYGILTCMGAMMLASRPGVKFNFLSCKIRRPDN